MGVLIVISIVNMAALVTASAEAQWEEPLAGTMHFGDILNAGEYSLKASQFSRPMLGIRDIDGNITPRDDFEPGVFLELYKNASLLNEFTLTPSDCTFITSDEEIKVTLADILPQRHKQWVYEYYEPWAKIEVRLRGHPELEVFVETDKNTYTSNRDSTIRLKVCINNSGAGDAENVKMSISTDNLSIFMGSQDEINQYFPSIRPDEKKSVELKLSVPSTILETEKYILSAGVSGNDRKDIFFEEHNYKVIAIVPPDDFTLTKYIKDRIYLSETATVILKVSNMGVFEATNIIVQDSIPGSFELESNTSLEWKIPKLSPGEEKVVGSYEIKPLEADKNGFIFPSSTASYTIKNNVFRVESGSPRVVVNGPQIIIEKIITDNAGAGNDIEVTVVVYNMGNAPTKVSIIDQLPKDAVLIKGNTSLPQTFLEFGGSISISYVMRIFSEGDYTLPSAVADYLDISNIRSNINKKAYSAPVNISVGRKSIKEPAATSFPAFITRTPAGKIPSVEDSNKIPGFGICSLALSILSIYFILKYNTRK